MKRTSNLKTIDKIGEKVMVIGWVDTLRTHGKIIFIDLRDRSGILQLFFGSNDQKLLGSAKKLGPEWVIEVKGEVVKRPIKMVNPELGTGKIEIRVESLKVISESKNLPFPIDTDGYKINEKKRLEYRYLDLRRKRLQENIRIRHDFIWFIRTFLQKQGFIEIETPILTKSTPEGARDFVVPSRLQPGSFYALPQSPQQYKQLLMVAGMERYFQIARCFRDEDPRADRAYGEFTQLDLEMSFTTQDEILNLTEELYTGLIKTIFPNKRFKRPFPRITYHEAMQKYGTDKPDLRKNKKDKDEMAFCFVVDFPLFEKTKEREISPMHHPFTAPKDEDIHLLDKKPMEVRSWQHDFVLNGFEIGGGSIRITESKIQEKVFKILGHTETEIQEKFGHLLRAFEYGVPPHGGIAPGIDRSLMVILGEPTLREVMVFPMTASGKTSIMNAPSKINEEQLRELHIKIVQDRNERK